MRCSIIVAMSENRIIGRDDQLPWKLPADHKRFRSLTLGHHLLLGRKTFESIGRPLPGRKIVVITRQSDFSSPGVLVAHSLDGALELCQGDDEVFIGGGAGIYQEALALADRIYLTVLHQKFEGDTLFPAYDSSDWRVTEREDHGPDQKNLYHYTFLTLERKQEYKFQDTRYKQITSTKNQTNPE